ncbi:MAG: protein TolQ [Deltaproteobacteria bacterium]|nr:protein TolQ [Deltaproteobacteria bacterium]
MISIVTIFPAFPLLSGFINNRLFKHIVGSGPVVKIVLLMLLAFSVISWAIIFFKYRAFKGIEKEHDRFLELFYEGRTLSQLLDYAEDTERKTPVVSVFKSGYTELIRFKRSAKQDAEVVGVGERATGFKVITGLDPIEGIKRAMGKTINEQQSDLESYLPFLATCGSTTPFIGLFGTVWGIMNAFVGIGVTGSASLATVAPGIAEALVATAAGLAAAIPAVIFYNFFLNRLRKIVTGLESFSSDFLNFIERNLERIT